MIEKTKILLSAEELQLASNSEWILTKHKITQSVFEILGNHAATIKLTLPFYHNWLPEAVLNSNAKIFKGENYLQLPYVLLDYPRSFDKENTFTLRTMFWWGNFFSSTLQLEGKYKKQFEKAICKNLNVLPEHFFICTGKDKWQHHFEVDNYTSLRDLGINQLQEIIMQHEFIKIAIKHPLKEWHLIPKLLENDYKLLLDLLMD